MFYIWEWLRQSTHFPNIRSTLYTLVSQVGGVQHKSHANTWWFVRRMMATKLEFNKELAARLRKSETFLRQNLEVNKQIHFQFVLINIIRITRLWMVRFVCTSLFVIYFIVTKWRETILAKHREFCQMCCVTCKRNSVRCKIFSAMLTMLVKFI